MYSLQCTYIHTEMKIADRCSLQIIFESFRFCELFARNSSFKPIALNCAVYVKKTFEQFFWFSLFKICFRKTWLIFCSALCRCVVRRIQKYQNSKFPMYIVRSVFLLVLRLNLTWWSYRWSYVYSLSIYNSILREIRSNSTQWNVFFDIDAHATIFETKWYM